MIRRSRIRPLPAGLGASAVGSLGCAAAFRASAFLLVLAVVGCGGEEGAPPPAAPADEPPTKLEFLAEADRICLSSDARIEAAADDLVAGRRDPPPAEVRRVVLGVVVPALETEVRAIRSLGAPAGDEARIEAILAATERGIAALEADPGRALDRPPQALREAGRLARAYGSRECGLR